MSRGDMEFLCDIQEGIRRIEGYISGFDYPRFLDDIRTQDAVVRNLEIIGEAAKNISEEIKKEYPQVPWKQMAGLRDRLIHHYFGVNYDIVWEIITEELPQQVFKIDEILQRFFRV